MPSYFIEVRHNGLNKFRVIRGNDPSVLEQKAAMQMAVWEEIWRKKCDKEQHESNLEKNINGAKQRSEDAVQCIKDIENTLKYSLEKNDAIDWDKLKDKSRFNKSKPQPPAHGVELKEVPPPPMESGSKYKPSFGFLDNLFRSRKQKKLAQMAKMFVEDYQAWKKLSGEIPVNNAEVQMAYEKRLQLWESEHQAFQAKRKSHNDAIDARKAQYSSKDPGAVIDYCDMVLSDSEYPDNFPQEFNLDFNPDSGVLIVDYSLPAPKDIPRIKDVKYVKSKDEFVETFLSDSFLNKLYDSLVYQMALRTVHELYEADVINALKIITFNGWVHSVDPGTGLDANACILSLCVTREEFLSIKLENVDPKECFRKLKGVGSSKLHSITPVAPIMNINREDKRFISSYGVAENLDQSSNLAAMDWEDFEHLIREIFEKEFAGSGGEVKVTRASRDAGVDAIAFDPDPIRGGKIVIQAKRYTNTVGVSAVRDLYGTVMNEGATKGILVTTTDYGPDAYEFVKGKPLTLLNGSNLLHLLEKQGYKATIDIKAAKLMSNEM